MQLVKIRTTEIFKSFAPYHIVYVTHKDLRHGTQRIQLHGQMSIENHKTK